MVNMTRNFRSNHNDGHLRKMKKVRNWLFLFFSWLLLAMFLKSQPKTFEDMARIGFQYDVE